MSVGYWVHKIPNTIIVNELPEKKAFLESLLTEQSGFSVNIAIPKKGKRKELIDLILKNINLLETNGAEPGLIELKDELGLSNIPKIIECFDISNHGGEFAVGSIVFPDLGCRRYN